MKEIYIDKQIGESLFTDGVTAEKVRCALNEMKDAGEKEAILYIDSPGGSVFEGFSIFSVIRDFARSNKEVMLTTHILGMAASAASIIALAAKCGNPSNKIKCEDNSVFMIHNAWTVATGDYREMEHQAALLIKINQSLSKTYCDVSKKKPEEIKDLMDAETWFFGSEITGNGFADEVIESENGMKDKALAFASAYEKFSDTKAIMKDKEDKAMNKVAALLRETENNAPVLAQNNKEFPMTSEELKQKDPALFASIFEAGIANGVEKERTRVNALMKMAKAAGCFEVADSFIRDGKSAADEDVAATFFEKRVAQANLNARVEDEPAQVQTPVENQNSNTDLIMAGFDKTFGKR